jgi:hypothetical protein
MGTRWRKYTRELLEEAVAASTSVNGVLRHLGLNQAGGTHAHISRAIKSFEIDTTHFVRFQNGAHRVRLRPDQILVRIPRGSRRAKPHLLRRALDEIGRSRQCVRCGVGDVWLAEPLTLEIDHIDEDFHNNEPDNLRYLCPNCHSQTPNFAGRSRNKYAHVLPDHVDQVDAGDG